MARDYTVMFEGSISVSASSEADAKLKASRRLRQGGDVVEDFEIIEVN